MQLPEREKYLLQAPAGQWECWVWNLKEVPEPSRNDGLEWKKEQLDAVLPVRYWGVTDAHEPSLPQTGSSAVRAQCHPTGILVSSHAPQTRMSDCFLSPW